MNTRLLLEMFKTVEYAHREFGLPVEELRLMMWTEIGYDYGVAGGSYREQGDVLVELPCILGICPAAAMSLEN